LHRSTLAKRVHFFLFLASIIFYFYGLGHLPLLGPDEPRYAQVAREMFLRGDYVTPTLGGHTWFEKPALLYWMEIAAFKIFGVSEWSARLGPAICGQLTIAAIWMLARKVELATTKRNWPGYASWSALIAASCLGLIGFSRGASFDIVVTMTTAWALTLFCYAELTRDRREQNWLLLGFYCLVGVSLIAKGLVGIVVPFGVVGMYYLLRREWPKRNVLLSLLWGLPLSIVVSSLWYGPVIYKHRWLFIDEFFIQHHFARYLSNKYHHPQPFYFYALVLLLLTIPWTPFLIDALFRTKDWTWRGRDSMSRLMVFSLAWLLFPIIFFSFSSSKLPGYILPVLPAALMLIGTSVTRGQLDGRPTWPIRATGALWLLIGLAGLIYGLRFAHLPTGYTILAASPLIIGGLISVIWSRTQSLAILSVAASVIIAVLVILNCGATDVVRRESTRDLLRLADARGYSNLRVLAIPGDDRSAQFYASGRVIYGSDGEPESVYDAPHIVAEARQRREKLLAFIEVRDLSLYRRTPGVEIIGDNGNLALVCLF
jgi:4-amino-4-deoxy-L-arabinose transferase-like glycosyltransferase